MNWKVALFTLSGGALLTGALVAMPSQSEWEIGPDVRGTNYSKGMDNALRAFSDGSVAIDFPVEGKGEWDALTRAIEPLEGAKSITIRYFVEVDTNVRFVAAETPDQPATLSLYIQREGDNWSAKGRYASYRWYAPRETVAEIVPGEYTMTVQLDDRWTNVLGKPNSDKKKGFAGTLANTARLGIAFGSHSRRSHGVYATGPARFTLLSYRID